MKRPLRVAQIVGTFGGGGAERMAWNLALGLRAIGHESQCLALRSAGKFALSDRSGLPVDSLDLPGSAGAALLAAYRKLRPWIRRAECDVLHVHGTGSLPLVALALTGLRPRPALVFTWHDSGSVLEGRGWRHRLLVSALRRCDRLYGSSRSVCERLNQALGLSETSAAVVMRNGVPVRARVSETEQPPKLVWLGRVVPDKDPECLVRACARLRDSGLTFRAVLGGAAPQPQQWYWEQLQGSISKAGLHDMISTPGWVDDSASLLNGASICVQTSHTEGLSMTLLEAMMAGVAVVATNVGDTGTVVEDGRTGLLTAPGDDLGLAEAISRLLKDPAERLRLADAGRALAVSGYTLEAAAARVAADYVGLIPK